MVTRRARAPTKLRAISVFSGVGGLDLAALWGAEMAGAAGAIETVALIENEPYCQRLLGVRFPEAVIYGDVRAVNRARLEADGVYHPRRRAGAIHLVYGGPPCQDVSVAGKRRGEAGDRWLWPEFLRLVGELRPEWVVAENPDGLRTVDAGRAFAGVLREFTALGYRVGWEVVAAADAGAPHRRERLCIVAHRIDNLSGRLAHTTRHARQQQQSQRTGIRDEPAVNGA